MLLSTHLAFDGQCAEAFKFYEKLLGGKITFMMSYGASPMANTMPPEMGDKIMHASLAVDGQMLMGADTPPGKEAKPHGFSVSIQVKDPAEAERIYNGLVAGGQVQMPMQQTFWSPKFGMCVDRFGIPWMINTESPQPAA
jgi:PhnB protein